MTQSQRYFNKKKVRNLVLVVGTSFALLCFTAWIVKSFTKIHFDWSFLLPFVGLLSSSFPLGTSIIDWFEKRLASVDGRLDDLESVVKVLEKKLEASDTERYELKGKILRLEVTYRAFLKK